MKKYSHIRLAILAMALSFQFLIGCNDEESPDLLKDSDGNVYTTVTIGTQTWMVENLRTTHYRNGDPIEIIATIDEWVPLTIGAYSSPLNADPFGVLYNGYAVNDPRNLCPEGWHIPTNGEWQILIDFFGGSDIAGGALKEVGTQHWSTPNKGATNSSGFSALPGGAYRVGGTGIGAIDPQSGFYWSSSESLSKKSNYATWLSHADALITLDPYLKNSGFSVRCIKD